MKVFWPREGYTKGDVIAYYQKIAPYILPYLRNRPHSLLRHPKSGSNSPNTRLDPKKFNIKTIHRRLKTLGDPFKKLQRML